MSRIKIDHKDSLDEKLEINIHFEKYSLLKDTVTVLESAIQLLREKTKTYLKVNTEKDINKIKINDIDV